jgi:hypothetical protein
MRRSSRAGPGGTDPGAARGWGGLFRFGADATGYFVTFARNMA